MVNTMWVNADIGRAFQYLADHVTKCEIREFLAFPFSFQLMFEQTLCNLKRNKNARFCAPKRDNKN